MSWTRRFELEGFDVELSRLDDAAYRNLRKRTLSIADDNLFLRYLCHPSRPSDRRLSLGEVVFVLTRICGPTSAYYDDWKGSFAFPFHLEVIRGGERFPYLLAVKDWRGCLEFALWRVKASRKEVDPVIHEPIEAEFSRRDINYFNAYLYGYMIGRLEAFEEAGERPAPFVHRVDSNHILYGYLSDGFFEREYEGEEEFDEAFDTLEAAIRPSEH